MLGNLPCLAFPVRDLKAKLFSVPGSLSHTYLPSCRWRIGAERDEGQIRFFKKLHKVIRQSGHGGPDSAQACMCTSSTPEMGRVEEEGTWVPVLKEQ